MFSPTLAMVSATASAMVMLPARAARILFTSEPAPSATSAIILTRPWNSSLRATKSVSELTSTTTALFAASATPMRPSAATRPAFLAALAKPFLRSQSTAASRSPPVSPSAALQSIIPAPVLSRSSFTMPALIFAIALGPHPFGFAINQPRLAARPLHFLAVSRVTNKRAGLLGLGRHLLLGAGNPALNPARQTDLFADLVGGDRRQFGDLPDMKDPEIVELFLDRRRNPGEFLKVIGHAPRAR